MNALESYFVISVHFLCSDEDDNFSNSTGNLWLKMKNSHPHSNGSD